jgi:hypothetical protein
VIKTEIECKVDSLETEEKVKEDHNGTKTKKVKKIFLAGTRGDFGIKIAIEGTPDQLDMFLNQDSGILSFKSSRQIPTK